MEEGQQADHLCLACVSQSLILSGVGTPACPPVSGWDICHGPQLCVCVGGGLAGVLPTEGLSHLPGAAGTAEGL